MGSQPVSDEGRQPVHKWYVAKPVLSLPVDAVCLEWIPPVRAEQHDSPTGFERTNHLAHRVLVVLDVLDHLVAQNQIKTVIGKGEMLPRSLYKFVSPRFSLLHLLEIVFQPKNLAAERSQVGNVLADSTAIIED